MAKVTKFVIKPLDMIGGPKRPPLSRKQLLMFIGILLFGLVVVNSYFLLKPDSKIERSYYLKEYEWQVKRNYKHFLTKQSVVASKEVIYITADATKLDQVKVKKGQTIYTNDPLALYNESTREQLVRQTEVELKAYNAELESLNDALIEMERQEANPPSNPLINTDKNEDNISVHIQIEIVQNNTPSEASAILNQHIAEVERKIEISRAKLDDLNETRSITSPINGSIGDIIYADSSVTFEIHSSDKNIITYLTEEQWHEVQIGQSVIAEVEGHDEPLVGVVVEKQEYPAQQSVWYQRLIQESAIQQDETVYEIRIDLNDLLVLAPFNSLAKADITLQDINDSYIVPSHWIVKKEIDGVSNLHIYTVDYDGKIRLEPIFVLHEALENKWGIMADEDTIAKHQLKHVISTVEKNEDESPKITSFTMYSDDPSILLNSKEKRIQAATFLPLPLHIFSFDKIGEVTWKDIVKYLFY